MTITITAVEVSPDGGKGLVCGARVGAVFALLCAGAAVAGEAPLDVAALRACAAQVQQLRSGATQLKTQIAQAEARRVVIDAQSAALQREADAVARDDLRASLDLQQRRQQHNEMETSFNQQMIAQRQVIDELNRVKADYERHCATRRYRRSDFAALSADAQSAMRAGLDDISVPYVDPAPVR